MSLKVATCFLFLACSLSSFSQSDSLFEKQLHSLRYTAGYIEKRADVVMKSRARRHGKVCIIVSRAADNLLMHRKTKVRNKSRAIKTLHKLKMGDDRRIVIREINQRPVYMQMTDNENQVITTFILSGDDHWSLIIEEKGKSRLVTKKKYKISDWTE